MALQRRGFRWVSGMVVTKNQPGLGPSVNWLLVFIFPVLAQNLWPVARERAGLIRTALRLPCTEPRSPWVGRWGHTRTSCPPWWGHSGGRDVGRALLSHFLFFFFSWSLFHSLPMTFCFLFYFSGFLFSHILSVYSSLSHFLYKKRT